MKQVDKLALCKLYEELLEYIGVINKGFILRSQLEEYCFLFSMTVNSKYTFNKALKELQEGQIIKQIRFMDTSRNIVMLKKFGIAYLKGIANSYSSQKIGAIKTCSSNERYFKSIMFNDYIIMNIKAKDIIKDKIKKQGVIEFFNSNRFNFFLKTDKYCELLESKFNEYVNLDYLKQTKESYLKEIESKKMAIQISRQSRIDKANGKEPKKKERKKNSTFGQRNQEQRNNLIKNGTIETLKKKGSYLRFIQKGQEIVVQLYYFDYKNQQDKLKQIEHLALTISICENLFKDNLKIKYEFKGYVCSEVALKKATRDMTDIKNIKDTLNGMYGLRTEINKDNFNVSIINLDIENKYLNDIPVVDINGELNKKKVKELDKKAKELESKLKILEEELKRKEGLLEDIYI